MLFIWWPVLLFLAYVWSNLCGHTSNRHNDNIVFQTDLFLTSGETEHLELLRMHFRPDKLTKQGSSIS